MKTLEIREMGKTKGGNACNSTSYALGVLMISQSLVFGTVSVGVGAACL